jgi:type I restriction enzyme, R subunit
MKPEELARQKIDAMLAQAAWAVQDRQRLNLYASQGVVIREFSMTTGPADYLLFVDGEAVGTIEAKKEGETLTGVEEQSAKYRAALPDRLPAARLPLPFAYESTGIETQFTSELDPVPRSRPLFFFHRPETLADWLEQSPEGIPNEQNNTLRARLRRLPPLVTTGLRDCQIEAITKLEQSLALNKPRALIQMATGSGKTYTAVSSIYRLIKFAGAKRVLFLVDRANLARQTLNEFLQYQTPDDGRKFTELYNVQHLQHNTIDPVAKVCITTIQRLYSILSGEPELDSLEEERSLFDEDNEIDSQTPKEVCYNPAVPIETFDVIITDECHRSIYNKWRGVLEYFDAFIIGLTATPNKQTLGFFNKNLVMEYGHERAVTDGVNVDYQVYVIRTDITERGSTVESGYQIGRRNRQTRHVRWESLQDDLSYSHNQLDRDVVATDQIRTVIRAFKDALFTDLFPGRTEVPKTLVFAKDDNHAEEIVKIVREEFDLGNEFAQKITYKTTGSKPEELIASFRNSYNPRIAVTVDMISTGTDIKPLEVLLFMRSVKSQGFFEQMKGRGTRTIDDDEFQSVTRDARSKTHFVLVDAVGVYERLKTDDPSLERKRSLPLKAVLEDIALGKWKRDEDLLYTLAGRLGRLNKRLTEPEEEKIKASSGGYNVHELAKHLVEALDPDKQIEAAKATLAQDTTEITYVEPDEQAVQAAARQLIKEAVLPFNNPDLREALIQAQQREDLIIDEVSMDRVLVSGMDVQAREQARKAITTFHQFIEQNRDEITALQIILNRPRHAPLHFSDIKQLAEAIAVPPLGLSTDKLWQAYETLDRSRVRPTGANMKHMLTDIVSLVRYTIERDEDSNAVLEPYNETVNRRFSRWLKEQEQSRGKQFTTQQRQWLELIRDHIATSLTIEPGDFDEVPFNQHGGLGKAYQLFGEELSTILQELNERLAA